MGHLDDRSTLMVLILSLWLSLEEFVCFSGSFSLKFFFLVVEEALKHFTEHYKNALQSNYHIHICYLKLLACF